MGAPRLIDTYRMIGPPNQNGDGFAGRTYGWIVDYGTYRTRLAPNGSGDHGSFFNAGETWYMILAARILSTGTGPERTENHHDVPAPGQPGGGVSPVAWDEYGPNGFGFFGSNRGEYTVEYMSGCSGYGGATHFDSDPVVYDDYIFHFVEVNYSQACSGHLKVYQQFYSAPSLADGPIVDLVNVRTLNPGASFFPGVQFWHGMYIPAGFFGGPNVQVDHMLAMAGQSWQEAWDDNPIFFQFITNSTGSGNASCLPLGTLNTGNFPVPNAVAVFLSDPPGPPIPGGAPQPVSASVNGSLLAVYFDQVLDSAFVAAPAQFVVMRNGFADAVLTVSVPGDNTCQLQLATPFVAGDSGSITYTQV